MHGQQTIQNAYHVQTPRKHIVPTHLNMPDQVLSLGSCCVSSSHSHRFCWPFSLPGISTPAATWRSGWWCWYATDSVLNAISGAASATTQRREICSVCMPRVLLRSAVIALYWKSHLSTFRSKPRKSRKRLSNASQRSSVRFPFHYRSSYATNVWISLPTSIAYSQSRRGKCSIQLPGTRLHV